MSRQLLHKVYAGEFPRPTAEGLYLETENLLIVSTPWGNKDALKEMTQSLRDCFAMTNADQEATSPFPKLPGLSPLESNLRTATLQANEVVFRKFNKDAYTTSCESLIIGFNQSEMAWIQLGQPHLLMIRGGSILPLQIAFDFGVDYGSETPMPSRLLGVERALDLDVKSLAIQPEDILVMICRSTIPGPFFNQNLKGLSPTEVLNQLFSAAATFAPKVPFWIGVFG